MGRPPIGERAMTAAEKQHRYRERKFGKRRAAQKCLCPMCRRTPEQHVEILQIEVRELRDELHKVAPKIASRIIEAQAKRRDQ